MTDMKYDESIEDTRPSAVLKFNNKNGDEVSFKVSVEFEGDWFSFLSAGQEEEAKGLTEQDARDGFAINLFERIGQLF